MKLCPKCDEPLIERKDKSKFCRNGCEIYTAVPRGSAYHDQVVTPKKDKNGNVMTGGGSNNLRRFPRFEK